MTLALTRPTARCPAPIATFADSHRVFTYSDALAHGYTQGAIRSALRTGTWLRLRRGVFIERTHYPDARAEPRRHHAVLAAAVLQAACRPSLVISGRSAALLHGLPLMCAEPRSVELTVIRNERWTMPGTSTRTISDPLRADQVTLVDGLPITTPARTLIDAADRTTRMEIAVMLDDALRTKRCTRDELRTALDQRNPRRGRRRIEQLIDEADGRTAGPFASAIRRDLLDHLGTNPATTTRVQLRGIGVVPVPLTWGQRRVAVIESGADVAVPAAQLGPVLAATGWTVVDVAWADVQYRPHEVRERIRLALNGRPRMQSS